MSDLRRKIGSVRVLEIIDMQESIFCTAFASSYSVPCLYSNYMTRRSKATHTLSATVQLEGGSIARTRSGDKTLVRPSRGTSASMFRPQRVTDVLSTTTARMGLLDLPTELLQAIVNLFGLPSDLQRDFKFHDFREYADTDELERNRSALSALSRTCRRLNNLATPVLYACLLHDTDDIKNEALNNAVIRIAASSPSILSNTRQLQIAPSRIGILQHTPQLTGLSLDWGESVEFSIPRQLPSAVFPNLLHLQTIAMSSFGLPRVDAEVLLQSLHHLPNLQSLLLFYLNSSERFSITAASKSLRLLELHGCKLAVTQCLMQGLMTSGLEELHISECDVAGGPELEKSDGTETFSKLSRLHLSFFRDIVTTGLLSAFNALEQIKFSTSYISEELMSELLEWLPATTRLLEMEEMQSLEILEPLYIWLERSGLHFKGLTIKISFDQTRIEKADYEMEFWDENVLQAQNIMDSASQIGIIMIPADLRHAIWLMRPEFDSSSEEEEEHSSDESLQMDGSPHE